MNSVTGGLDSAACMPEWASAVLDLVKSDLQGPLGLPPPFLVNWSSSSIKGVRLFFPHLVLEGCSRTSLHRWLGTLFNLQYQFIADKAASFSWFSFSLLTAFTICFHTYLQRANVSLPSLYFATLTSKALSCPSLTIVGGLGSFPCSFSSQGFSLLSTFAKT